MKWKITIRGSQRHELELKLDRVARAVLDDVGDEFRGQRTAAAADRPVGCEICSGEIVTDFPT